jgi:hypothetical protein
MSVRRHKTLHIHKVVARPVVPYDKARRIRKRKLISAGMYFLTLTATYTLFDHKRNNDRIIYVTNKLFYTMLEMTQNIMTAYTLIESQNND